MQVQRTRAPDSRIERQIIMGMVVSTEFLTEIKPLYSPKAFNIDYAREVASWCIEYFEKYKKAPGKDIEEIFHSYASNGMRDEQVELISSFLLSISDEYERGGEINVQWLLDNAEKHFRLTSLNQLRNDIGQSIMSGRLTDAEALVKGYVRVTRPETEGVDPMCDISVISNAFREDYNVGMFSLPGDLGKMVGDFHRGYLVGILGAPGVGKTWGLQQLAIRGALRGYNVLLVSLEMSRDQMVRRIQHSLTGLPNKKYAGEIRLPVFDCKYNQHNNCNREQRTCRVGIIDKDTGKPLDFQDAPRRYVPCSVCKETEDYRNYRWAVWGKMVTKEELDVKGAISKAKSIIKSNILRGNRLRLIQHPSNTFTMTALRAYLHNLEHYEDFVVDMIVTDFAQKFKLNDNKQERHALRDVWEEHKAIAQERHVLVVTASQTSAARSGRDAQRGDWGETIAPLELCDIAYILNQTPEEKDMGLIRVKIAKQRHEEYELSGEVKVLYSYKIGQAYLDSYYGK